MLLHKDPTTPSLHASHHSSIHKQQQMPRTTSDQPPMGPREELNMVYMATTTIKKGGASQYGGAIRCLIREHHIHKKC